MAFAASVGEEPLRLLSYIAENDLPYTEIVTAEYTMANELLCEAFPIDRIPRPWAGCRPNTRTAAPRPACSP